VVFCLVAAVLPIRADELIRSVQKKLADLGYYKGRVDGSAGSMTHAAIRRYQIAEELKVTGEINRQTLEKMGLGPGEPAPDYSSIGRLFPDGPLKSAGMNRQVEALRATQEKLAREGLYAGPLNGLPGASFEAALREWQAARGLAANGLLDAATAGALGIPLP